MREVIKSENFTAVESLQMENSFTVTRKQDGVELEVSINIFDAESGSFELYDIETGGEEWYAEGCLDIDGKNIVGYDGVFDLPRVIKTKLVEMGYSLDEL